jgi:hypothetical protein
LAQCSQSTASTPCAVAKFLDRGDLSGVSEVKRLIATTTGTPNCFTLSMWRPRLAQPFAAPRRSACRARPWHAAVHLQRPDGGDDHRRRGLQAGARHLMSKNFLGPEIGAEARLRDHVIGELQRRLGGDDGIAAMGDVGERAAMDEGRVVFQRLHQVGLHRLHQQHGHGAVGLQVARVTAVLSLR